MPGSAVKPLGWRDVVMTSGLAVLALWATDALPTTPQGTQAAVEQSKP